MAGTGSVSVSDLSSTAARLGMDIFQRQANNDAPLLASGLMDRREAKGEIQFINIWPGGIDSSGYGSDNAALNTGSGLKPLQGSVSPVIMFSRATLGRIAVLVQKGVDSTVDLIADTTEAFSSDVLRKIDRSFYNSLLNPDGYQGQASAVPVAGVYTDIAFDDTSAVREGDAVDLVHGASTFTLQVTKILDGAVNSNSANIAGFVTLSNTVAGITTANGSLPTISFGSDLFYLRGGSSASNRAVSFADIGGATSLHGIDPTTAGNGVYGWTGITVTSFGAAVPESFQAVIQRVRRKSGKAFTGLILGTLASAALGAAPLGTATAFGLTAVGTGVRYDVGADRDRLLKLDQYESGMRVAGKGVLTDPNCPENQAIVHNKTHQWMVEWMKPGLFEDGDGHSILLDRSNLSWDLQFGGVYNSACNYRRALALISGISSL